MHDDCRTLAKSNIKRKKCHTAVDFGQVWAENDTHDQPLDKVITQRTMAKCGKNNDAPLLEDFVSLRTSTKCGPKCAPHQRTLSCSGLQPNVAQNVPLIGGLCHAADLDQMWPKICPSLEDFVTQRTSTKCGPECAPRWRTLSRSRL
jgi:hypothetical protein